ncbi:MAG TPA: hypothetical protein VKV32_02670 [Stellaceae bacterium]|nr:hypothetical protein [Stellaceae bacterium]
MLPLAFSLLRSEFGDFVYARIDAEDGPPLTVLSAFARNGIDPWQEAAKLHNLPPEAARRRLAATIATMSEEPRSMDEALAIADRLIAFLPPRASLGTRLAAATRGFRARLSRPFGP